MNIGLKCVICGHKEKYNLNKHLKEKHNITTKEYKKKYPGNKTMTGHSKRTVEYWYYKGYSYDQSVLKVKEFQSSSKKIYINNLINLGLTKSEAQYKWNIKQSENSQLSINHYLKKGYSRKEAIILISNIQSINSKLSSKFKGHNHTDKTKSIIGQKVKEQIKKEGALVRVSRTRNGAQSNRSKSEIECYNILKKHFKDLKCNVEIEGKIVDMIYNKLIIEYYGDYWHRNPKKYNIDHVSHKKTSQDIWNKDLKRLSLFNSIGYNTYIIWESDWKEDNNKVINELYNIINGNT